MAPTTTKTWRPEERDRAILDHVRRFRISTPEVIHRLYFSDKTSNAVTKVTTRLREEGNLVSYPLFEKHIYFVLGPKADPGNERAGTAYGTLGLVRAYGTLAFCCLGEEMHDRLDNEEWEDVRRMLGLSPGFAYLDYFMEQQGSDARLNWIRVDHGADRRRLVQICRRKVYDWMHADGFDELVKAGRFGVTLVTAEARKQASLNAAFEREPIEGVPVRVALVPGLSQLIAYQTHAQHPQRGARGDDASERL